jgi:hypothetical protein
MLALMIAMATELILPAPSWGVLFLLILMLLASTAMFVWQVQRWTTNRGWRALLDWSRERGFRLSRLDEPAGEPLDRIVGGRAHVTTALVNEPMRIFQIEVHAEPIGDRNASGSGSASASSEPGRNAPAPIRWHVLVRRIGTTWPATALRPSSAPASLIDEFSLSGYPRMGDIERFTVFGTDSHAARILSKSQARALLPPDIGMLLHGQYMVLDFSSRPFDGIELGRMVALAEQLEQHIPVA